MNVIGRGSGACPNIRRPIEPGSGVFQIGIGHAVRQLAVHLKTGVGYQVLRLAAQQPQQT